MVYFAGGDWAGAVFNADGCPGDCVCTYHHVLSLKSFLTRLLTF